MTDTEATRTVIAKQNNRLDTTPIAKTARIVQDLFTSRNSGD